jgi:hypothetical protein
MYSNIKIGTPIIRISIVFSSPNARTRTSSIPASPQPETGGNGFMSILLVVFTPTKPYCIKKQERYAD